MKITNKQVVFDEEKEKFADNETRKKNLEEAEINR